MCSIIAPQQFENQLPRILSAMLALYKKDSNHLPITMGLCQLLDVAIRDESQVRALLRHVHIERASLQPTNVPHSLWFGWIDALPTP